MEETRDIDGDESLGEDGNQTVSSSGKKTEEPHGEVGRSRQHEVPPHSPIPSGVCARHWSFAECSKRVQTLYNGLSASLVGTTVSQGVYFYFYSALRSMAMKRRMRLEQHSRMDAGRVELHVAESLCIASLAGMANVVITNPIWIVATRMQAYRSHVTEGDGRRATDSATIGMMEGCKAPSTVSVIASIYNDYGIGGFWNGVRASLIMVINPTIQYAIYEWLMSTRSRKTRTKRPSSLEVFLMSALAKAGATVMTYPMLTVKTRMMSARKYDEDLQYSGVTDAIVQIMKREGLGGYYRGMSTKITQSILGAAILLVCKERITDITREFLERMKSPM